MEQSEQINELSKALSNAQKIMKGARKNKTSNFHDYADINSVLQACKIHLSENDLSIMQPLGIINGKMVLYTQLTHSSGQWIRSWCFIDGDAQGGRLKGVQAVGSGLSYMKRYSLCSLIGLEAGDEDDDGTEAAKAAVETPPSISREKAKGLESVLEECDPKYQTNFWKYLKHRVANLESMEQLPVDMYENINDVLLKKRNEYTSQEKEVSNA